VSHYLDETVLFTRQRNIKDPVPGGVKGLYRLLGFAGTDLRPTVMELDTKLPYRDIAAQHIGKD
jgi:hypothetical protein